MEEIAPLSAKKKGRGIVLFSGGLDSILACKVLQEQGVEVVALKFVTPFFGQAALKDPGAERSRAAGKYGIDLHVADISSEYIAMLRDPAHGYGRYFNPCLDCKILMVRLAVAMLPEFGAHFVATGEVIGQRPMSQRRDAMNIVERDAGAKGLLLRPLCAHHFPPTEAEKQGLVDRDRLLKLSGRGRKAQMSLAERFGIEDYPTPAGGCVLADPILSKRFRRLFRERSGVTPNDCLLAQAGRHFHLPGGGWLVVGRNKEENRRIHSLACGGDLLLFPHQRPGPIALLRGGSGEDGAALAASVMARYMKCPEGSCRIRVAGPEGEKILEAVPIPDQELASLRE